jgi:hypothetical protein
MRNSEGLDHVHMKKLTFRHNGKRVKPYHDWSDEREKEFLIKAHNIIDTVVKAGVAMSVDLAAYRKTIPPAINRLLGGPYGFCTFMCLLRVSTLAREGRWKEPCACFFESGSGYGKQITTLQKHLRKRPTWASGLKAFRPRTWTFIDNDAAPQLEAADMLAYEANHFWYNLFMVRDGRPTKKSLQNLAFTNDRHWGNYFDEAKMKIIIQDFAEQGILDMPSDVAH